MTSSHHLHFNAPGNEAFEVRSFVVEEELHEPFCIELEVDTPSADVDLDEILGQDVSFELRRSPRLPTRRWTGMVTCCRHVGIDVDGICTYEITIRPRLWLLSQQRRYRVFQQQSDPDVVLAILAEWGIQPRCAFDAAAYLGRKYRVQYAESDLAFVSRLLEDSGITYFFEEHGEQTRLVLSDAPSSAAARGVPLSWVRAPVGRDDEEIVTRVQIRRRLRPGRYTQRDVDYRRSPELPLMASDGLDEGVEARLERFHHNYGAFLYAAPDTGETPVADDRGAARTNLDVGRRQVARRLAAKRNDARRVHFETTAHDVAPGHVVHVHDHPREDLGPERGLLVVSGRLEGTAVGDWEHRAVAAFADAPYHPPLRTPKPHTLGLESATVVGPDDDEIHTDEHARVRVQFHWDRQGQRDPNSSCWIPVNQPWGGAGFGALSIPRVGQEVLVDFLGEDPDRPVIVGRVFTKTNPVPYALPHHKTVSGIRSHSANQGLKGMAAQVAQQLAQQVVQAGAEAAGEAGGGGALGEALSAALARAAKQAFGERMPPLGSLLPQAAAMLSKLPQPGGAAFPSTEEGEPPPPPLTDGSPSRAEVPMPVAYPDGPRGEKVPTLDPSAVQVMARPSPAAAPTVMSDAPAQPPPPPAAPPLPEMPQPEMPMNLERLQAALDNGFGAMSPNETAHLWAGSEVTMDDTFRRERLYVQAQRDQSVLVRNNANTIVSGSRKDKVGTSDVLDVGARQVIRTGEHRGVDVRANQLHIVTGDIEQASIEGSQRFTSAQDHTTTSRVLAFVAEERINVDCGAPAPPPPFAWNISGLLLMPELVMLDGPKLFINPGQEALEQAMATGEAPPTADEEAEAAAEAEAADARGVFEQAWREGHLNTLMDRPIVEAMYEDQLASQSTDARNQAWSEFVRDHGQPHDSGLVTGPFPSYQPEPPAP